MKILALDTASYRCSVAVVDNGKLIAEITNVSNQTHSKHLLGMIDYILNTIMKVKLEKLDGFAVNQGPGSFTGLRIGLSTIKGLSTAFEKPVVGISALDAIAKQIAWIGVNKVCVMQDAKRGEVYFAIYHYNDGVLRIKEDEKIASPSVVIDLINKSLEIEPKIQCCLFAGSGAFVYNKLIKEKIKTEVRFAPENNNDIKAEIIALLAQPILNAKKYEDLLFVPSYIRKSDAEINYKNKE